MSRKLLTTVLIVALGLTLLPAIAAMRQGVPVADGRTEILDGIQIGAALLLLILILVQPTQEETDHDKDSH